MQASLKTILEVLGKPDTQYVIPVFQRVYSWTRRQCDQLWEDMLEAASNDVMHFMGTLIYTPEGGDAEGVLRSNLIDGQQRFTTITLLLIALRDVLRSGGDEEKRKAEEIDATYLHAAKGICKLQLSEEDSPTLLHLVDGTEIPKRVEPSKFLVDNLDTFRSKMHAEDFSSARTMAGLETLTVVSVELEADDSPQQVFESLNSKGRPLSTTDLIRNTLLIRYGSNEQERLFDKYWVPIDEAYLQFGGEQDIYLDAALHYWISQSAPGIHAAKRTDLYQAFKSYIEKKQKLELEDMLKSINEACLEFAQNPGSKEAKQHIDWAIDKPTGMINTRKIFGD